MNTKSFLSKAEKTCFPLLTLVVFGSIILSCEPESTLAEEPEENQEEQNDNDEETAILADSRLIGSWRNIDFGLDDVAMSFEVDSLGTVTYYRKNQITGKFEKLDIGSDIISVESNILSFLRSDLCQSPRDSIYEFQNDTLLLPLQRYNWSSKDRFVPVDFDSYEGNTRPTSSMSATITSNFPNGTVIYNHEASSDYELITGYYTEFSNNLFSIADNEFGCHNPAEQSSQIILVPQEIINGLGMYEFNWVYLQLPSFDEEFSTIGINTFTSAESPIIEGGIEVTFYEELGELKHIQGTFNVILEAEFNGGTYTVELPDGEFDIYIKPNP